MRISQNESMDEVAGFHYSNSELETIGLKGKKTTENSLRKEHGLPPRASYRAPKNLKSK